MPEAEYPETVFRRIMDVFLPPYNAAHHTDFVFQGRGSPGDWVDCRCVDAKDQSCKLEIQYVRAAALESEPMAYMKRCHRLCAEITSQLHDDRGLRGFSVHLDLREIPERRRLGRLTGEIVQTIATVLETKSAAKSGTGHIALLPESIDDTCRLARACLRDLTIAWAGSPQSVPAVAITPWNLGVSLVPDTADRLEAAVTAKSRALSTVAPDLVLLVGFDFTPFDEDETQQMLEVCQRLRPPFREVWVSNALFDQGPSVHKVWP